MQTFLASGYGALTLIGAALLVIALFLRFLWGIGTQAVTAHLLREQINRYGVTYLAIRNREIHTLERWGFIIDAIKDRGQGYYWCEITCEED